MTTTTRVDRDAVDPKRGMTLDEVSRLVQEALRAGADGSEKVHVTVNMRGGIKEATINVAAAGDDLTARRPRTA
jgi:hypothetical protein